MTSISAIIEEPSKKGTRTASGQHLVLILVQVVIVLLLVCLPYCDRREILVVNAEWPRWLGLAVVASGQIITISAVRSLGRNYSAFVTIQEQHHLVQNGIYSVIRNPIYLGMLLSWAGACLVFRSWLFLPVLAFFLGFAILRGGQEERILREEFSDEFETYRRRTWRIAPYVY